MLSRFISRPSHLRFLTLISSRNPSLSSSSPLPSSPSPLCNHTFSFILESSSRRFSSNRHNNGGGSSKDQSTWKISPENDNDLDSVFGDDDGNLSGIADGVGSKKISAVGSKADEESWLKDSTEKGDIFDGIDKEFGSKNGDEWETAEGYKQWSFVDEEKGEEVFDLGEGIEALPSVEDESVERETSEAHMQLEKEEQALSLVLKAPICNIVSQDSDLRRRETAAKMGAWELGLKGQVLALGTGPNRAFGDLIAASGITEAMLDSLIALKDLEGVDGLPPLREIEDIRFEKNTRKSTRAEIERMKQEEVAKARVRQVDEKGRAYGTGRRKCSIARVWVLPGDGKFTINDKQFDVYFPMLDHRAALLRPFSETKTLGLWDVNCTVKGGGVTDGWSRPKLEEEDPELSVRKHTIFERQELELVFRGQVGAIQLGISRALQNWEPGLRPSLRSAGFLTRDPRVVERKKPGKAKARKSFQWVKR
ncbi:hypothetical protein HHK36_005871 [Tetracentron sinense]|uniref:Ribosomal protein S9 n=1 Tax=Tetracentron sinense TaxID=13715 RepID=A0A834ZW63_TETSI|nr:hypothetical protein HHK36_005871 [Tetracentron sinense]